MRDCCREKEESRGKRKRRRRKRRSEEWVGRIPNKKVWCQTAAGKRQRKTETRIEGDRGREVDVQI